MIGIDRSEHQWLGCITRDQKFACFFRSAQSLRNMRSPVVTHMPQRLRMTLE